MTVRSMILSAALTAALGGCSKPFISLSPTRTTMVSAPTASAPALSEPTTVSATTLEATTQPTAMEPAASQPAVVTRGSDQPMAAAKPRKPFIKFPSFASSSHPSTELVTHASPDSPVPLSEYAEQPVHEIDAFHLRAGLSAAEVVQRLGQPAQIADVSDPWYVYRLSGHREIWLHFAGPGEDQLTAADVIRGAENGFARERVFPCQ